MAATLALHSRDQRAGGPEQATPHSSRFAAIGIKLPERRVTTDQLLRSRRHRFPLDLEKHTGIRERRVCGEGEDSLTLAVDAAADAVRAWDGDASALEMVISCSITRYRTGDSYQFEPSFGFLIKQAIGAERALHFDVSNACAGMLTGVHILNNFIRRGVIRRGMVVSGEHITSLSTNAARTMRTVASKQLASLTLGDAGAAVILERRTTGEGGVETSELATYAEHSDLCIGGPCEDGPGGTMTTDTSGLHRAAILSAPSVLLRVMARTGITPDDIDHVIPHQTSVPAIRAGIKHTERKVGAYSKDIVYNVEELGNTSSTTHFVALHHCLREGRFKRGDRVALLCYASGLTVGLTTFTVDPLLEQYGRAD